jgi:Dna[CI] antecedent, DciA
MRGRRREQAVGDLVSAALRGLGVPPTRVGAPLEAAFERALEPAWRGQVRLERLQAGVLDVAVASAALKDELTQFHATRLLGVLREAVPAVPLTRVRFLAAATKERR